MKGACGDEAVERLRHAVELLCEGQMAAGREELGAIDRQRLADLKLAANRLVADAVRAAGWKPSKGERRTRALPLKMHFRIYNRDGWTCQWEHCRRPTVAESVVHLVSILAPDEFGYTPNWPMDRTHPILWTHTAQLEHVVPASAGGSDEEENLCTVCSACQYSKYQVPASVLGWHRSRPDTQRPWDGLTRYLPCLIEAVREARPAQRISPTCLKAAALQRGYSAP